MRRSKNIPCRGWVPVRAFSAARTRPCSRVSSTPPPGSPSRPTASPASACPSPWWTSRAGLSRCRVLIESRSTTNTIVRPAAARRSTVWGPATTDVGIVVLAPRVTSLPENRANNTLLGWPATVTVKSDGCRSRTGRPLRSSTVVSTVMRSSRRGRSWAAAGQRDRGGEPSVTAAVTRNGSSMDTSIVGGRDAPESAEARGRTIVPGRSPGADRLSRFRIPRSLLISS